jgi:hypothetical protein
MSKKKITPATDSKRKVIYMETYKKEWDELKTEGAKFYKPKIGRRLKQLEKKMKLVA